MTPERREELRLKGLALREKWKAMMDRNRQKIIDSGGKYCYTPEEFRDMIHAKAKAEGKEVNLEMGEFKLDNDEETEQNNGQAGL